MKTFILVLSLVYYSNGENSPEAGSPEDEHISAESTETAPCENGLNAELLVLPPVVLGYDGDDSTDDEDQEATTLDPQEQKKEEEKKEIQRLLEKLNKYTLKFEGNFDLPTTWYRDDTRRGKMPDGLENLLRLGLVQNMLQSTTPNFGNAQRLAGKRSIPNYV